MKQKLFFFFFFFFCSLLSYSQVTIETENNDLRVPSLPYYNFGKGLGITAADSLFQLNLRFRMQNRAAYYFLENEDDEIEAKIRRLRLRFDGFVGDPRFQYVIQLSFASDDLGELQENEDRFNVIRDAIIMYRPNEKWNFIFGQTKLPGNRQRVNSSGALQLTDRTINNAKFNIDRDFGFQLHYLERFTNRFSYHLKSAISSGKGRNFADEFGTRLAYTGKVEVFPFGVFKNDGRYFEGDILREETPKLMLSAAFHQNNGAVRDRGQVGLGLFETKRMNTTFLESLLKYQGWAASVSYMNRNADDVFSINPLDPTDIRFVFVGEGYDTQLSYIFPSNWEFIGRYSTQRVQSVIADFTPSSQEMALGVTKYIWEHAFKVQLEVSRRVYELVNRPEDWYVRFQVEIGI